MHDILQTLCKFLNGNINYCVVVNNKCNIKNNRYQFTRKSNAATMGNYCVNTNLLLIAEVSSKLLTPKVFV